MSNHVLLTTDHLAIATLESPNTATRSHVDIVNSLGAQLLSATNVVDVIRIAAIDDHITGRHNSSELVEHRVDKRRRNHQPDRARRLELCDKSLERHVAG